MARYVGDWHYGRWLRQQHFRHTIRSLNMDLDGKYILDAGCGEGAAALFIAHLYPTSVVHGCDVNTQSLDACRRKATRQQAHNVSFSVQDIQLLSDQQRYDFAYSIHVLESVEHDSVAMSRLYAAVRPGGTVLIETIFPPLGTSTVFGLRRFRRSPERPSGLMRDGYTARNLTRLLESSGFTIDRGKITMSPPALFAHTVFEVLRERHFRVYLLLLPILRMLGWMDVRFHWKRGASLMMVAHRAAATQA